MGNIMTVLLIYLVIFIVAAFVIFFFIRSKVSGKILILFIERDKALFYKLFRPKGSTFKFEKEDELYNIMPERVLLVNYPLGGMMPKFLQQIIPCLIYSRNNPNPLDPSSKDLIPKGMTSSEESDLVSEKVIRGIINTAGGSVTQKSKIPHWLIPAISLFLILVMALMLYTMSVSVKVMGTNIDTIQKSLERVK